MRSSRSFKNLTRFGAEIEIFSIPERIERDVALESVNFSASSRLLDNSLEIDSRTRTVFSTSSRSLKLAGF